MPYHSFCMVYIDAIKITEPWRTIIEFKSTELLSSCSPIYYVDLGQYKAWKCICRYQNYTTNLRDVAYANEL